MGKGTSIRLDFKTEWALEIVKRRTGRTWTAIIKAGAMREVEHALSPDKHDTREPYVPVRFDRLWHADEAVRYVRLLFGNAYPLEHGEDEHKVLIEEHRDVWFTEEDEVNVQNTNALHSHLAALTKVRRDTHSRKKVAEAIAAALKQEAKRGKV